MNHEKIRKLEKYITKNECHIKPAFVLNNLVKHLKTNNMLPAICFVFSRKGVERLAQTINVSLFEAAVNVVCPDTVMFLYIA